MPHSPEPLPDPRDDAERLARLVLDEDGPRDLTTAVVAGAGVAAAATLEFRGAGVLAGVPYAEAVTRAAGCVIDWSARDAEWLESRPIARIRGDRGALLRVERPLLNLLQRGSGIATLTRRFVEAVAGTGCRVLHTRKTAPGLRRFDVGAVVAGGGEVHRLNLAHTVMVKDNHWRFLTGAGRSLAQALDLARARGATDCQVEVESEAQVREACAAGADRLLVDNQPVESVRAWGDLARTLRPGIAVEATGGITLANARAFALADADYISVGALTHSPPAADIAMELD